MSQSSFISTFYGADILYFSGYGEWASVDNGLSDQGTHTQAGYFTPLGLLWFHKSIPNPGSCHCFFEGLNEITQGRHLAQCMEDSMCVINNEVK